MSEIDTDSMVSFLHRDDVEKRVSKMIQEGKTRFALDFSEIYDHDPDVATTLITNHKDLGWVRDCLVDALVRVRCPEESLERWKAVLCNLPHTTHLRKLDTHHIGHLTQVSGIVVSTSDVQPFLLQARFICIVCDREHLIPQREEKLKWPGKCDCDGRKFTLNEEKSDWVNSQVIQLQELPEELPPGQIPRQLTVRLLDDLVDTVRAGDRSLIVGIVRLRPPRRSGRLYDYIMEAEHIQTMEAQDVEVTEEDLKKILELGARDDLEELLIDSLAPTIYGHREIKRSILYLLIGGVSLDEVDVKIRGNIHVLLCGDPGTAKSQMLTVTSRVSTRGLLTAGKTSTNAGLTATVQKDTSGRFVLEAGAMVLADKGVLLIDEIDKMTNEDREAIHFPMEGGTVPVAKGGIVATLNARTSILAAANPKYGRYNPYSTVAENINLPVTILSRFDLIWILKDTPNVTEDGILARHILNIHQKNGLGVRPPVPQPLLKKYLAYASKIQPKLTREAVTHLENFFVEMRAVVAEGAAVPISARNLESGIRLSQARARIHLRDEVTLEDATQAVALMHMSLSQVGIDATTGQFDVDMILTGKPKSLNDKLNALLQIVRAKSREEAIPEEDVVSFTLAQGWGRSETIKLLGVLMKDGVLYSPRPGVYKAVQPIQ